VKVRKVHVITDTGKGKEKNDYSLGLRKKNRGREGEQAAETRRENKGKRPLL